MNLQIDLCFGRNNIMLVLNHITVAYKNKIILHDISFSLPKKKTLCILGKSGCGKSTLLSVIAGLLCPTKGNITVGNKDVTNKRGHASFMQQNDLLFPHLTIIDNVALPLRIQHMSKTNARAIAFKLLKRFSLDSVALSYPITLSGGMKQRIALMRSYAYSSNLLLLDEPFARLDAITKLQCREWCKNVWNNLSASIVMVTHDIDEALEVSDFIAILAKEPARFVLFISTPRYKKQNTCKMKKDLLQYLT